MKSNSPESALPSAASTNLSFLEIQSFVGKERKGSLNILPVARAGEGTLQRAQKFICGGLSLSVPFSLRHHRGFIRDPGGSSVGPLEACANVAQGCHSPELACRQARPPVGPPQGLLKAGGNGKIIQWGREGKKHTYDFWHVQSEIPKPPVAVSDGQEGQGSLGFSGCSCYDVLFIYFCISVASDSWQQVGRKGKEGTAASVGPGSLSRVTAFSRGCTEGSRVAGTASGHQGAGCQGHRRAAALCGRRPAQDGCGAAPGLPRQTETSRNQGLWTYYNVWLLRGAL